MDLMAALTACGGVARREDLMACGVGRRQLSAALAAGVLVRPHRGCYALPTATRAHVLAAVFRARVTCITALDLWRVPLIDVDTDSVHLAVPRDRGVTPRDPRWQSELVVHRGPELTGVRVVDTAAVLAHASQCLDFPALVVATDHLLSTGAIDARVLDGVPGSVGARLRSVASAGAESPPETLARLALIESGFTPREQMSFSGVGRVDLVVDDCVVVEVDGRNYHSDPAAFIRDRRRDRLLTKDGYRILRFAASEVFADRQVVARDVAAVVGAPRGSPYRA